MHRAGNPTPTILPLPVKLRLFKVDVYAFGFIVFRVLDRAAAYEHWLERVVLGAAILPPVHGGDEDLMDEVCQVRPRGHTGFAARGRRPGGASVRSSSTSSCSS